MSESAYANLPWGHFQLWNKWWFWGPMVLLAACSLVFDIGYMATSNVMFPWYIPWACIFCAGAGYYEIFRILKIDTVTIINDMLIPFTLIDMMAGSLILFMITASHTISGWGILIMAADLAFIVTFFHFVILKMEVDSRKKTEKVENG